MSGFISAEPLNNAEPLDSGDDLFDMDVNLATTPPPPAPDEPQVAVDEEIKHNAFAGIEDKLGLPFGSTKEGIRAAKETTKAVVQSVKDVKSQLSIIESKEQINGVLPVPKFDMNDLANDRARLREIAFKNLEMANRWLNTLDEQIRGMYTPSDENWAAAANMYKTVSKGVADLTKMLVTLRQEEELAKLQLAGANGSGDGGAGGDDCDPSDPLSKVKGRTMTPQETIALIREWGKERDAEIEENLREEVDARQRNMTNSGEIAANPE